MIPDTVAELAALGRFLLIATERGETVRISRGIAGTWTVGVGAAIRRVAAGESPALALAGALEAACRTQSALEASERAARIRP